MGHLLSGLASRVGCELRPLVPRHARLFVVSVDDFEGTDTQWMLKRFAEVAVFVDVVRANPEQVLALFVQLQVVVPFSVLRG